ncbi:MAG: class I SAM-dependent methyltransferase [Burkholderiaceae bacterium]
MAVSSAPPQQHLRLFRLPSVQALLVQCVALGLAGLTWLLLARSGILLAPLAGAFLQGALAAMLSRWRGQAAWWRLIHFLFLPAALAMLALQLPPWLFLATFLAMLALYWSTFRTQVPFYASGSAAWDAVAMELPQRPLRIIDIGSGLGGLALDIAARRPDCQVVGIELAPLPWLVSWLRRRAGDNCRFLRGDYQALDFADYDVVFAYLSPAAMPQLWSKARAEMRPGTLLLSHEFTVPEATPQIRRPTRPGGPLLYGWHM